MTAAPFTPPKPLSPIQQIQIETLGKYCVPFFFLLENTKMLISRNTSGHPHSFIEIKCTINLLMEMPTHIDNTSVHMLFFFFFFFVYLPR